MEEGLECVLFFYTLSALPGGSVFSPLFKALLLKRKRFHAKNMRTNQIRGQGKKKASFRSGRSQQQVSVRTQRLKEVKDSDKLQQTMRTHHIVFAPHTHMVIKQAASDSFYWLLPPLNHLPTPGPLPSRSRQGTAPEHLWGGRSHSFTYHMPPLFNGLLCHYGRQVVVVERQNGEMEGGCGGHV